MYKNKDLVVIMLIGLVCLTGEHNSKLKILLTCDLDRTFYHTKNTTQLKPELIEKYHIIPIGLFGSVARDDFTSTCDIDIIVDFSKQIGIECADLAVYIENNFKKMLIWSLGKGFNKRIFKQ